MRRAVEATVAAFGGLDILVNNAGICPLSPFDEISEAEWDRVLAVNLKGAFLCCQAALPHLRQAGRRGRIINIASVGRADGRAAGRRALRGIEGRADRPDQVAGQAAGARRGDGQLRLAGDDLDRPDRRVVGRDASPGAGRRSRWAASASRTRSPPPSASWRATRQPFITGATLDVNGGLYLR